MNKVHNLKKYLTLKNGFKLICGANNENYFEIEKLVALYSKADCKFFDINASFDAYKAAINGLKYSNCFDSEHFICISVGTDEDMHFKKCAIDFNNCTHCAKCKEICPQKAINDFKIDEKKCIGCLLCFENCPTGAIKPYKTDNDFDELFSLFSLVDCIEFHISSSDVVEIKQKWNKIISNYNGLISICINRSVFSEKNTIDLLNELIVQYPYTMIQADGKPMSGNINDYNTTLQAVAFADLIRKSKISCPLYVSGGTNSKTKELLKLFSIDVNGISIGSYARKIVKKYIDRDDFLSNRKVFEEALNIAKDFTNGILN